MGLQNDNELVERLVPKILSSIRTKAKAVESVPVKQDLSGITSLPCYDTTGGQYKTVLVPINALKEPALESAQEYKDAIAETEAATEAAKAATSKADTAREKTEAAIANANKVAADLVTNGQIILLSEDEYNETVDNGKVDETKLYFAYEEE